MSSRFNNVEPSLSYPEEEVKTMNEWRRVDAFRESVRRTEGMPEYSFYDGPPFATGLPHYGHLLAGTIKDTVTRYASQTGHHVTRRFGWDCHGLPVEFEIDKKLGIKGRDDVLKLGIKNYNAECRNIVQRYAKDWEQIVERMGRWIDFENDYKTLDITFMESVWWVFGEIFKKGLVYKGFKVMPFSTACSTPLSNFEAGQNYKDVQDPAVVVSFPLVDDPEVSLLAWTTTPWTLPSNLALCVNPGMDYCKVKDANTGKVYIMMESRLSSLFKQKKGKPKELYTVLEKMKGKALENLKYTRLFDYFSELTDTRGAHRVLCDAYVTDDSGTGIVHQAPAFGEDDFRVCVAAGIVDSKTIPCPVDFNGRFTEEVTDFVGMHVKEADVHIINRLKEDGRLVDRQMIFHSYPFCWRSETPLIYKTVPSWFIDVPSLKDRLLANNEKTYWVPAFVKEKRFANWLSNAREWCISRNRFWGTPVPIWTSEDGEEVCVISSIAQLEELSGEKIEDLHRDSIDHITIPSKQGKGVLRRVDEVFDCWFESGSMPYAQKHYPFEEKVSFEKDYFPADFIAEGLDQTRGWFYTLLVISTALFDQPPFKNLVVNGLVLAADGKKMSKSKKNYPDPKAEIIDEYGADALRLYLINSQLVRAEELCFVKEGVRDVGKDIFNPWYNAYRFFVNYANKLEQDGHPFEAAFGTLTNVMDKWILSSVQSLVEYVRVEMEAYRLYTVVPKLVSFIDLLTNWYVRLNRPRLKGQVGLEDARTSLAVLFEVLMTLCRAMAPFTPFLVEMMYRNLKLGLPQQQQEDSVHYLSFPTMREELVDLGIERSVKRMQAVVALGRYTRDTNGKPSKIPVKELIIVHSDEQYLADLKTVQMYIMEELNVKAVNFTTNTAKYVTLKAIVNQKSCGRRLGKDRAEVVNTVLGLDNAKLTDFKAKGEMTVCGHVLTTDDIQLSFESKEDSAYVGQADSEVCVLMDMSSSQELLDEGTSRTVLSAIQRLRKSAGVQVGDNLFAVYDLPSNSRLPQIINTFASTFEAAIKHVPCPASALKCVDDLPEAFASLGEETLEVEGESVTLKLVRAGCLFARDVPTDVKKAVVAMDYEELCAQRDSGTADVTAKVGKKKVLLTFGKDVFLTVKEFVQQS